MAKYLCITRKQYELTGNIVALIVLYACIIGTLTKCLTTRAWRVATFQWDFWLPRFFIMESCMDQWVKLFLILVRFHLVNSIFHKKISPQYHTTLSQSLRSIILCWVNLSAVSYCADIVSVFVVSLKVFCQFEFCHEAFCLESEANLPVLLPLSCYVLYREGVCHGDELFLMFKPRALPLDTSSAPQDSKV